MSRSLERLLDDGDLIRRVVDHEISRERHLRRLPPQQPRTERMKRRQPDALRPSPPISPSTRSRISPRGLVGERDRQHFAGFGMPVADEVRDAIGDDARLARARASKDQQRTVDLQDGFALFGVEVGEEVHWGRVDYSFAGSVVRGS